VNIPDERFDWLCNTYRPKSKIPAFLEVVDIAGLVKGAADGAGLGNAFLSNISVRLSLAPATCSMLNIVHSSVRSP
jgi:ribosome-binding ATPase YchF (GTP1/OBG family)